MLPLMACLIGTIPLHASNTDLPAVKSEDRPKEIVMNVYNMLLTELNCCQASNIRHTLVGHKIVDHSDVVGASPVGAAPTTSSFSTEHLASMDWAKTTARQDEKHLSFGIWCDLY